MTIFTYRLQRDAIECHRNRRIVHQGMRVVKVGLLIRSDVANRVNRRIPSGRVDLSESTPWSYTTSEIFCSRVSGFIWCIRS